MVPAELSAGQKVLLNIQPGFSRIDQLRSEGISVNIEMLKVATALAPCVVNAGLESFVGMCVCVEPMCCSGCSCSHETIHSV